MRRKKLINNILFSFLLKITVIVYGFLVPNIIISKYGSEVNGLIVSITQFLGYICLLESGIGPVIRSCLYKPLSSKNEEEINNILYASNKFFKKISYIFICYILILLIIYPFIINDSFDNIFTIILIIIISISTFCEYYFGITYKLLLKSNQSEYIISIIEIATYIFSGILTIVLVKLNFNILVVKLVSGLIFVLRPTILNIYVRKKYHIDFSSCDKNYKINQKMEGLVQHIASTIHSKVDVTILTLFNRLTDVSIYSVYNLVVTGVQSIVSSLFGGFDALFGEMIAKKELDNLNKKFNIYELLRYFIISIVYSCSFVLILPFIKIYTVNFDFASKYINNSFGMLIVLSQLITSIRYIYSPVVLAGGYFKETRTGSIIEAVSNIVISLALFNKYGLIGIILGTVVSFLYRAIEFMCFLNKNILKRNVIISIKKAGVCFINIVLIMFLFKDLINYNINNYIDWFICGLYTFIGATIITFITNYLFFRKELKLTFNTIFRKVRKK